MTRFGTRGTWIGFGSAALMLAAYPQLIIGLNLGDFWITLMLQIFVWVTLATTWNLFSGYSGYSSFGHGAFFGIGVYTTATLMVRLQVAFPLALLAAGFMAAAVAWLIGFIVFRLSQFRGELFSLLTLALTFIIATIVTNVDAIDGGRGVYVRGAQASEFALSDNITLYYVALLIVFSVVYLAYAVFQARWGQALFAIRDDEDVADGLGVPTFRVKLWTFAISSFFIGLIGGTQAVFLGYLEASNVFSVFTPLLALMMAIFGGSGQWYGPIIGATLITVLRQTFTSGDTAVLNQIIIGLVLILTILFIPDGIAGLLERLRQRLRRPETSPPARLKDSAA